MQPSRTATVCEVDRARKRAASRLEGSEPRIPDKPLETYHPETNRLTATCSCEACSAFTRVAARTLARSPICDQLHRRLQPFRYLHDCSGCFRLERLAGRGLHPLESAALSRRTREADIADDDCIRWGGRFRSRGWASQLGKPNVGTGRLGSLGRSRPPCPSAAVSGDLGARIAASRRIAVIVRGFQPYACLRKRA